MDARIARDATPGTVTTVLAWSASTRALGGAVAVKFLPVLVTASAIGLTSGVAAATLGAAALSRPHPPAACPGRPAPCLSHTTAPAVTPSVLATARAHASACWPTREVLAEEAVTATKSWMPYATHRTCRRWPRPRTADRTPGAGSRAACPPRRSRDGSVRRHPVEDRLRMRAMSRSYTFSAAPNFRTLAKISRLIRPCSPPWR